MSEILSPEEIEALIVAFSESEASPTTNSHPRRSREALAVSRLELDIAAGISPPKILLNEVQMSSLRVLNLSFASATQAAMRELLQASVDVMLASQSQTTYGEYGRRCGDSLMATFSARPLRGALVLEMGCGAAHSIIDQLLDRIPGKANRNEFNEVEHQLAQRAIEGVLSAWAGAWNQIASFEPCVTKLCSARQSAQIALMDDPVVVVELQFRMGASLGAISLCMPNHVLKPFLAELAISSQAETAEVPPTPDRIPARLTIELMDKKIVGLLPGFEIELNTEIGQHVQIMLGNRVAAIGEVVQDGHRIFVRVIDARPERLPNEESLKLAA